MAQLARRSPAYSVASNELEDRMAAYISAGRKHTDRYRLDPWAHLEDGHVMILGLSGETGTGTLPPSDVAEDEPDAMLTPMLFRPYQHEIELGEAWVDLDYLIRTARSGEPQVRFRNVTAEKSRQMGYTWTTSWILLWTLMYFGTTRGLALHLNAAKVDDHTEGSTDSIFGRIRYMAASRIGDSGTTWPNGLQPVIESKASPVSVITNPLNHATLVGGAATEDPGRGGTYTHVLVDEAARIPWARSVHIAIRAACPRGRMYGSTPYGEGNLFHWLVSKPRRAYRNVRLHWTRHPIYGEGQHTAGAEPRECEMCAATQRGVAWDPENPVSHRYPGMVTSPWYDRAIEDLTDEEVAQELDISYERSLEARVYPEFRQDVHVLDYIAPDRALSPEFSWDFGLRTTAIGIWQDHADMLCKIGELECHDMTPEQVSEALRDRLAELGFKIAFTKPSFTRKYLCVGDPAGRNKEQTTAYSVIDDYRGLGWNIATERQSIERTIRALKRLLQGRPKPVRYSAATCPLTVQHIKANRWPVDRQGVRKLNSPEPLNDAHNHMMRADAYYACFKFPPPQVEEQLEEATYEYLGPYRRVTEYPADDTPDVSFDMRH